MAKMEAIQTRAPIEPRYNRRFGEYLESILRKVS
jgi:hypothetical protein